jgi:signal transduction histidine kinase
VRLTLIGLLVVPLTSLLALWAFAATLTLGNAVRDHDYTQLVALSADPSATLASRLAQERLETFNFLNAYPQPPQAVLYPARRRTDAAVAAYRRLAKQTQDLRPAAAQPAEQALLSQLVKLPLYRISLDAGGMSPAAAFRAYTSAIDALLRVNAAEYQGSDLAVNRQTDASIDADRALEFLSRETALVSGAAAAKGQLTTGEREEFAAATADQRLLVSEALSSLEPQLRAPWAQLYASPAHRKLAALENRIIGSIGSSAPIPVDNQTWQSVSQAFMADMQQAEIQNAGPLATLAGQRSFTLLLEAVLAGGAGLLAVVASILLTLWLGRRLTGELTALHDTALEMAGTRLPLVVRRLRAGEEVDVAAESPSPSAGKITEIARVATAFGTVQRTAVQAAVGQAALRKSVNQVFLNLSLRNQSLLHRQLGMLDEMERATNDPAALADLFRLDHLTTRMRRHAEGLIILSGATPGRGWREPVPVIDVLGAAIAEVEDYTRVELASQPGEAVAGAAVNDVIHLLAELVENATTFSPPGTKVDIRADLVGNGLAVEIEDRGLGLPADRLASINTRLASPPEFDLADTEQLGLFVVGRLAAGHGITVSLRESPFGGTTAIVLLPHSIIVPGSDLAAEASEAANAAVTVNGLPRRVRQTSLAQQPRQPGEPSPGGASGPGGPSQPGPSSQPGGPAGQGRATG